MNILNKLFGVSAPEEKQSATHQLIALQHVGAPAWTPRDYASLARNGYSRNVIAYRCIRLIAEAASSVPMQLCDPEGQLSDHPLLAVMQHPNNAQSSAAFLEEVFGHLQTAGNAYIEAVRINGGVRELYALRPDRVKVRPDGNGWPGQYEYTVAGRTSVFAREDDGFMPVLHLKIFNPINDYYGTAPLEAASDAVDIHNAAASWNKALLDNAARPSGALVYKGVDGANQLSTEQFDRLKAELQEGWQGRDNAGRPLVLDGGLDWKQLSLSPSDMDFIDAKHSAARDIALAFGVPPQLLGIPGDSTYSNYREANLAFWRQTILPLVSKVSASLSGWLCETAPGMRISYDATRIDALSPERAQRLKQIAEAPFLTDREKRIALGFPGEVSDD
jgi:HK97 family phage portal protein